MYKLLCVLAVVPLVVLGYPKSYPVVQCDSGAATPIAIRVDGCAGPICEVKRGDPVNYEVDFRTNTAASSIKINIKVKVGILNIDLPLTPTQSNGCLNLLAGSCPYQNNQVLTHRGSIPVPSYIPVGQLATITANYNSPSGTISCAKLQGIAR